MKVIMLGLTALLLFSGCSTKEMKSTVKGWGDDISNAFEGSTDKSKD